MKMIHSELYAHETALVIVNAQNMWFHPDGKMHLDEATRQIPTIANLASHFRERGSQVIYTQVVWDSFEDVPKPLVKARPLFKEGWVALKRGSVLGQIHSDLAPQPRDLVVEKKYFDAFQTGNLEEQVDPTIKNLAFTGTTLNNCVYSSLLGASQRGYHTLAVRDCISAFPGDNPEHWYKQMGENLGTQVLAAEELIRLLK